MRIETWGKVWCPACKAVNWLCQGNLEDLTVCDVVGICCHSCQHKFRLDGEDEEQEESDDIDYQDGLTIPR